MTVIDIVLPDVDSVSIDVLPESLDVGVGPASIVDFVPEGPPGRQGIDGEPGPVASVGGIAYISGTSDVPLFDKRTGTIRVATPEQYAKDLSGTDVTAGGTNWRAAMQAALDDGRCLVGKYGKVYPWSGRVTTHEGAYIGGFGAGAAGLNAGSTTFQATSADAGFDCLDGGATFYDVMLDGNSVATNILHWGSSDPTHVGETMQMRNVSIIRCAAGSAAMRIEQAQNGFVQGLVMLNNGGEAIRYDTGANGWCFYGVEITGSGSYAFHAIDAGSFAIYGGIGERGQHLSNGSFLIEGIEYYEPSYINNWTFSGGNQYIQPATVGTAAAVASTDTLTLSGQKLFNGQLVQLSSSAAGGLSTATPYWVLNSNPTAGTFQLTATQYTGSAVDITSNGNVTVQKITRTIFEHRASGNVELNSCCYALIPGEVGIGIYGADTGSGVHAPVVTLTGVHDVQHTVLAHGTPNQSGGGTAFIDGDAQAIVQGPLHPVRGQVGIYGPMPLHTSNLPATNIGLFPPTGMTVNRTSAAARAFGAYVNGDAQMRYELFASGTQQWGPGGSAAADVLMARNAAASLIVQASNPALPATFVVVGDETAARRLPIPSPAKTLTADSAVTINCSSDTDFVQIAMAGHNVTGLSTTNAVLGQELTIVVQRSSGTETFAWPLLAAGFIWDGFDANAPVLPTIAQGYLVVKLRCVYAGSPFPIWEEVERAPRLATSDNGAVRALQRIPILAGAAAAATANIALTGTQTIDGYAAVAGDTILATAQTTGSQNGPWVVAAGAWTRPTDYPAASVIKGRTIQVNGGTANGGTIWSLLATSSVTVDTTATTWVRANKATSDATYLAKTTATAKGDLLAATASGVVARHAVGANGTSLVADSTQTDGLAWGTRLPAPGVTLNTGDCWFLNGAGNVNTAQLVQGREFCTPFYVDTDVTINTLMVEVTTIGSAGSVIRLGIRQHDVPTGLPGTLIVDAGTVVGTATGQITRSLTNQLLPRGWYWVTATGQGSPTTQATIRIVGASSVYFPAPMKASSFAGLTAAAMVGCYGAGGATTLPSAFTFTAWSPTAARIAAQVA